MTAMRAWDNIVWKITILDKLFILQALNFAFPKVSKTETLDLCQLPRLLFEIHKMINLPASVKIFKNKLKNWETDKSYFHHPHQA